MPDLVTEWELAAEKAREVRETVAGQVRESLLERAASGSEGMVAHRLREYAQAKRERDPDSIRAAVMELTLAAAELVVSLDLARK